MCCSIKFLREARTALDNRDTIRYGIDAYILRARASGIVQP